jgi:hypothetical protein
MVGAGFAGSKAIRKLRPSSLDNDNGRSLSGEQVAERLKDFGKEVFKVNLTNAQRNPHRAIEFARISGRDVLFMNPDGVLFNDKVETVTYANDGSAVIIHIDYEGNYI